MYNKSGIYKILNNTNGKFYIGSAKIFRKRKSSHLCALRHNEHENIYLQRAWNKLIKLDNNPEEEFSFHLIEFVEEEKLIEREQYYLDTLQPWRHEIGYNICRYAGSRLGVPCPEHIKKYYSKLYAGENSLQAKLKNEEIKQIRKMYVEELISIRKIAERFSVSNGCIQKVLENKSWIDDEYVYEKQSVTRFAGENHWNYGRVHSKEFCEKTSERTRGENNPRYGVELSDETKKKIGQANKGRLVGSKNPKAKLTQEQVLEILQKYENGNETYKSLSKEYNVSESCIANIIAKGGWGNPKKDFSYKKSRQNAKTNEEIKTIYQDRLEGMSMKELSNKYKIDRKTIKRYIHLIENKEIE